MMMKFFGKEAIVMLALILSLFSLMSLALGNVEVDALIAFKNNLVDPREALSSWDDTLVDPCTWFHVECNDANKVINLDLLFEDLSGHLVPDLANLTSLQHLVLHSNKISGKIPPELGKLANPNLISFEEDADSTCPFTKSLLMKISDWLEIRIEGNSVQEVRENLMRVKGEEEIEALVLLLLINS
ncbi:hypothetical protein DM860_011235 [Cuscuta australis]|uniref:Leucine-rich repeat-containing N-terminal plant-type domain-containing protein n=1 Tax=Cuscuta australis TaxID=267555 RepID=A0A328DP93_9ASTE|nr:hypothetical protein DM860_011235 [Cuscuta australis]